MINTFINGCGCRNKKSSDISYDSSDDTSKSSVDYESSRDQRYTDGRMKRQEPGCEIVKQNGLSAFLSAISPRNLFRGFRKNAEFSMPKAERSELQHKIYSYCCIYVNRFYLYLYFGKNIYKHVHTQAYIGCFRKTGTFIIRETDF